MELLECLRTTARKLELSDESIVLLYAFNRGLLGKLGTRTAFAIISNIAERYELQDGPDDSTYGTQLAKLGILTAEEGYLFSEGYLSGTPSDTKEHPSGNAQAQISGAPAFDGKA